MKNLNWSEHVSGAHDAAALLSEHIAALTELRDAATAEIAKYLRASGADLDLDAIQSTPERPYTLVPSGKSGEWYLIQWRGIRMPTMIGWLEKQEPAFNLFRVTRSMDLLTPFPQWVKEELDIKPPAHGAVIDGGRTSVRITSGDEGTFRKRYGAHLGAKQSDGTYKIKPDAWIQLVAQLIKDGILPYQPTPVAAEDWIENARCNIKLRAYQTPLVDDFKRTGATLLNIPPGAGKTYVATYLLAHLRGPHLVVVDTDPARTYWKEFIATNAPDADVTVTTYQGASKYIYDPGTHLAKKYTLFVPDEAHRLPAATFSKLAFIEAKYRLGPTGTAWREDDKQYMITALTGFPAHLSWSEMIRAGVLKKPRIVVEIHKDLNAKTNRVKELIGKHKGRALIFADWIAEGNALANALGVPFIQGETKNKLQRIREAQVSVVSRVADTGIDLPDLSLVIDFAFMKNARTQGAQRLGRLLHSEKGGAYHLLLTTAEYQAEPRRMWGIEQELSGEVDIEFLDFTGAAPLVSKHDVREAPVFAAKRASRDATGRKPAAAIVREPKTEADKVLANPAVDRALTAAYAKANARIRQKNLLHRVLRLAWEEPLSLETLRLSGRVNPDFISAYKVACDLAVKEKFMTRKRGVGFQTNRAFLNQLVKADERFKR